MNFLYAILNDLLFSILFIYLLVQIKEKLDQNGAPSELKEQLLHVKNLFDGLKSCSWNWAAIVPLCVWHFAEQNWLKRDDWTCCGGHFMDKKEVWPLTSQKSMGTGILGSRWHQNYQPLGTEWSEEGGHIISAVTFLQENLNWVQALSADLPCVWRTLILFFLFPKYTKSTTIHL